MTGVVALLLQASSNSLSASRRVRKWITFNFASIRPVAGRSGLVSPSTCGKLTRMNFRTPAFLAASTKFFTQPTLVSGRNLSGKGANRTPARWTTQSIPLQTHSRVSGRARSARQHETFSRPAMSKGTEDLCTSRRNSYGPLMRYWESWEPRLPDAPAMRIFTQLL